MKSLIKIKIRLKIS